MLRSMSFRCNLSDDHRIERPTLLTPPSDTHKYARGAAVVYSGPALRTGASRLAARAALAIGAGLVTLMGDHGALQEHAAHVTAIMLREAGEGVDDRVKALAIGPGAGLTAVLRDRVLQLLQKQLPIVIDADAITVFEGQTSSLFEVLHGNAVLTPHEGEFGRLFPSLNLSDRQNAAHLAAQASGAVVLLKGPVTVVAAPDGRWALNRHSSSWLATAGSGDILTGLICGLMAQDVAPFDAACIAAWIHGDIGVRAGPGLTADHMLDLLPVVLKGCLKR